MNEIILPTIHTNGTGRTALQESYGAAAHAVFKAIKAVETVELNGRDYYVDPDPAAFQKARAQHEDWLAKLAKVRAELLAIVEHCEG